MNTTGKTQDELLQEALNLIKPIVVRIESSLPTTKDHYGDYMGILATAKNPEERKKMAMVLIIAGANKNGVLAALALT